MPASPCGTTTGSSFAYVYFENNPDRAQFLKIRTRNLFRCVQDLAVAFYCRATFALRNGRATKSSFSFFHEFALWIPTCLVLLHIFPMMERKVCCCTNATYGMRLNAAAALWNDQTDEPLRPKSSLKMTRKRKSYKEDTDE
jgi:hypothetical protein